MKRIWIVGFLGLGLLAGCTPAQEARVQENVQGVRQEFGKGLSQAQKAAADQALEGRVKQVLNSRKGLDSRGINVEARGGTVTLQGEVPNPAHGSLAEQAAMEVAGVQGVINQLTMRVPATGAITEPATHPAQGR